MVYSGQGVDIHNALFLQGLVLPKNWITLRRKQCHFEASVGSLCFIGAGPEVKALCLAE